MAGPALDARLQAKAALIRAMQVKRFNPKSLNPGNWARVTGVPALDMPSPVRPMTPQPASGGQTGASAPIRPAEPFVAQSAAVIAPRPRAEVATLDLLTRVNRQQNRRIVRATDTEMSGREDVWSLPVGQRPRGDCEDYVLAKRKALIDLGVSPDALSIAVVRTRQGEGHAVLLARTAEGEYVLDNLSPWVAPWTEAPYQWIARQGDGAGRPWVQIGEAARVSSAGGPVIRIILSEG